MPKKKTIAIMTGGGDAPGLNAVIRAVVKYGVSVLGWDVIGIEDSLDGLLETPRRVRQLGRDDVRGILRLGGTILGTTNRGNPFSYLKDGVPTDRSAELKEAFQDLGCDGMIAVGGDGTMGIASRLMDELGIPVVGVPKTIDNDIPGTDVTFGFDTAVSFATDAVDRLHATAEAHDRVMVVEVMGRDAGHIALWAGVGGGADVILIPEIPFRWEPILGKIKRRKAYRRYFSIVVVAEGAHPDGEPAIRQQSPGTPGWKLGGIGDLVAHTIAERTNVEARCTVLGHLQRGGNPTAFDRVLATRLGAAAVELVEAGDWGKMVAVVDGRVSSVTFDAIKGLPPRTVSLQSDLIRAARGMGITFGDEASTPMH
jgi:6-phosphofructokinase 1